MSIPVQILSLEATTALGGLDATHAALSEGRSALQPLDDLGHPDRRGARLPDAGGHEDDPALRILGRHGRALEPVLHAAHAAGHGPRVARERLALFLALGMVDAEPQDLAPAVWAARDAAGQFDLRRFFAREFRSIHPLWPLSMLNNVAAGQLAIDLDIRGDNLVVASDADGGVRALLEAAGSIQAGHADAALVAGASEPIGPFSMARWALERDPAYTPGEACGAWLLASPGYAGSVGATPCAALLGAATTFGAPASGGGPAGNTFARAIERVLHEARRDSVSIDLVVGRAPAVAGTSLADTPRWSAREGVGSLGPAAAFVEGALALRHLGASGAGSTILVLTGGAAGGAGALVLESA